MKLTQTIRKISPAVVAFGSRLVPSKTNIAPGFPLIIGTGFIVDERGMVLTNQHVIDAIAQTPKNARFVMLFPDPVDQDGQTIFGVVLRQILAINSISSFESSGPYFGATPPDFGFVQIDLPALPVIEICGDPHVIEVGLEVATLGFPMGDIPLTPYEQGKASQISAFARRGIISSVLPCECADPHGFSIDILSEGGASGSPIFRTDDPRAIGILHAGINGAPITYAVPGHLLQTGLELVRKDWHPNLTGIPTLMEIIEQDRAQVSHGFEWTILKMSRD
jgi:S1-C subfamily serine protease